MLTKRYGACKQSLAFAATLTISAASTTKLVSNTTDRAYRLSRAELRLRTMIVDGLFINVLSTPRRAPVRLARQSNDCSNYHRSGWSAGTLSTRTWADNRWVGLSHLDIITMAAATRSGKRNATVWYVVHPSVCLSRRHTRRNSPLQGW